MSIRSFVFSSTLVLVATAASAAPPAGPAPVPFVLSAQVEGRALVIRGSDLVPQEGIAPFVTISGEPVEVLPPMRPHEIRVALPDLPRGTYLLTVAAEPTARQAGVLSVSLDSPARERRFTPASDVEGVLHVCANRRHMRIVDDPGMCNRNETEYSVQGMIAPDDGTPGDGGDGGTGDGGTGDGGTGDGGTGDGGTGDGGTGGAGPTDQGGEGGDTADCPGNSGGKGNGNGKNCDKN